MVRILPTKKFQRQLYSDFARVPSKMTIVSPFLAKLPGYDNLVQFAQQVYARNPTTEFTLVTNPPSNTKNDRLSFVVAGLLENMGVELLIRSSPFLHSKIYLLEYEEEKPRSFVGSANFTIGGLERNDETTAFFMDDDDVHAVRVEIARLTGRGAVPYRAWLVQWLRLHPEDRELEERDENAN